MNNQHNEQEKNTHTHNPHNAIHIVSFVSSVSSPYTVANLMGNFGQFYQLMENPKLIRLLITLEKGTDDKQIIEVVTRPKVQPIQLSKTLFSLTGNAFNFIHINFA